MTEPALAARACIAIVVATLSCTRAPAPIPRASAPVVTLLDYFELGEAQVERRVAAAPDDPTRVGPAVARDARAAVARLRIHFDFAGGSHSTAHASAALIDGGRRALTVAHAAIEAQRHPDARVELALTDGRTLAARVGSLEHYDERAPSTDWAVLEVVDPPADLPAFELGDGGAGELLVLGFPGRVGVRAGGRAALDAVGLEVGLLPVRVLCARERADVLELEVVAGSVPIGGMSGAPCVDPAGRLVAIQRAVSEQTEGESVRWRVDVVGLAGVREALAR